MTLLLTLLLTAIPVFGSRILLPELTGPHNVGLRNLELVDYGRVDPFSPSGSPRDLMVTLFYPTSDASSKHLPLAPQFSPAVASHVDDVLSLTSGTAASLTTRAHLNAPLDAEVAGAPVVLFSHGFGFTRGLYTALLQDLASWGWVAVAVDHPYDAGMVEYPDGRVVPARNWSWPLDPPVRKLALDTRTADLLFVLKQLSNTVGQRDGLHVQDAKEAYENHTLGSIFNTSRVVALGHSFGGATAVETLLNSSAVIAATDLDGFLYGPVVRLGTDKPVLVLGFPEHYATDDETAAPGWPALHGWKRDFTVIGTVHESYTDYSVFADILGGEGPKAGTVAGKRMIQIQRTYINAFFGKFLSSIDDNGFLNRNDTLFPEVSLRRS
ncbi:platelet-activating factor acetylhydrolase [Hypomontagnella monticulosa]|nr:platelet-activating factor acetylhydrolase [Hypomontagnella monticulosa]